ncbi:MAG TPA: gamma-glutamyl-gamma-aminobutyrate hydrolase family protein [Gemmatimonadales bacterium]|nr:gamma-glutamyl-gamma-aminobutyrate hydrolase family protein [Gemmatimonadales bacterium]
MTRPRIGITGRVASIEGADRSGVNASYLHAAASVGAPVILSPLAGPGAAADLLDGLDALILSGGADVAPAHYHRPPHPKLGPLEPERDAFELALLHAARERQLPVLAICRGLQLVNVALGGTLWQDLPSELAPHPQSGPRTERAHEVAVDPTSRLADALGTTAHRVNSFHHQAIRDLAPGLAISARAPDGVVEGVESTGAWWLLGVQWHPEAFWAEAGAPDLGLFRALAAAIGVPRP